MKVPFIDLRRVHDRIRSEIDAAIAEIIDASDFVLGRRMYEFEKAVAEDHGVAHAVGVASGTDALIIALRAAGIREDTAVITTPFTFIATTEAITVLGAKPIFCDISAVDYNLSPDIVAEFIQSECVLSSGEKGYIHTPTGAEIACVLPVHLFGQCTDMAALMDVAFFAKLAVIEDAAQAYGAECRLKDGRWRKAGAIGDVGCFSFYPSKNLGGFGDGGMILTNDEKTADACRALRVHGSTIKYYHHELGYNSRLDTLQAAILLVKKKYINEWITERRHKAEYYTQLFIKKATEKGVNVLKSSEINDTVPKQAPYLILPSVTPSSRHTFNSFNIRVSERNELIKFLASREIGCTIYYPLPLHLQKAHASLGYKKGDMPVAEAVARDIIAIPFFPGITENEMEAVVDAVIESLTQV
ncbi:MAG: DegT/DnrJ/EryC1/StrS family aminotransferase [bacterium]